MLDLKKIDSDFQVGVMLRVLLSVMVPSFIAIAESLRRNGDL